MTIERGKIYKIVNTINNDVYIGCTINSLKHRFNEHLYRCYKTDYKSKLYNSIKKYGQENFIIELIEVCDISVIYETEKKYIKLYDSFNNGLNATLGGEGCLGYKHSESIRKKISENTKNGNSHKNKTYEELYSEKSSEEKDKRRTSVKKHWESLSDEEKSERILRVKLSLQKKSKYSVDFIREIKNKIEQGLTISGFREMYPQLRTNFYYELKNGKTWSNV
jgi:group I intron endonuclease